MKKTMAEVAANIESRVSFEDAKRLLEDKVSRADFHFQIQNKPSFDDIKTIMEQMAVSPQQEMFEDELTKMRTRIEELYKEVSRKAASAGGGSSKEIQALTTSIDQRFAEVEEKLNEKANKQSVAQALHRKSNKSEIEAILLKKAELSDLQRIIQALENKIDLASFEALVRAVEMKPDRHELGHVLPSSYRNMSEKQGGEILDKSIQFEIEKRINDLEK